jgi:hypothetical protein
MGAGNEEEEGGGGGGGGGALSTITGVEVGGNSFQLAKSKSSSA